METIKYILDHLPPGSLMRIHTKIAHIMGAEIKPDGKLTIFGEILDHLDLETTARLLERTQHVKEETNTTSENN